MPIYEYEREDGTVFEVQQRISEDALATCPATGQKVQRIISRSAFHLKGGGWYKTDYNASSAAPTAPGEAKASETASTSEQESATPATGGDSASTTSAKACGTACGCH